VWNVITADKYSFFSLRGILLSLFLRPAQALVLWMLSKCKVQTQISKVSRVQVHSLREGLIRGLGVRLTVLPSSGAGQ